MGAPVTQPHELGVVESLVQVVALYQVLSSYVAMSVWLIDRDLRKLPPLMLRRAYSMTSFAAAIFTGYQFGIPQVAVLVHFIRTRRSLWGVMLGLFWAAVAYLPGVAFALLLDLVLPE